MPLETISRDVRCAFRGLLRNSVFSAGAPLAVRCTNLPTPPARPNAASDRQPSSSMDLRLGGGFVSFAMTKLIIPVSSLVPPCNFPRRRRAHVLI